MVPISLLSLNEDVLLAIFSLLGPNDALAASSTSRFAYRLAIPRAYTELRWSRDYDVDENDASEAHALQLRMQEPAPLTQTPRVRHLRHFTLDHFVEAEVPFLRRLLSQAFNLRTIFIQQFQYFIDIDPPLIQAFGAMHNLENARLIDVGPETIAALPTMFSSPAFTTLELDFDELYYGDPNTIDLDVFVSTLAAMPNLHTLTIISYTIPPGIVSLCPNITTLSLLLYKQGARDTAPVIFSISDEDRWPATLRELQFPKPVLISTNTSRRIGHIDLLALGVNSPISGTEVFGGFLPLLAAVRPTGLELQTKPNMADAGRVWAIVFSPESRLRSLEVVVKEGECDVGAYMDPLLTALRSTSLISVSLHFPPRERRCHPSSIAEVEDWRAAEVRRVEALRSLPMRLIEAIPSLRLVALSACAPASSGFDTGQARARCKDLDPALRAELARESDVERRWGPTGEFVNPALRRLRELQKEIPRDWRWWWVKGEGAARTPVEIWREDGERAEGLVERADFDATKTFDGFYSARCRYERQIRSDALQAPQSAEDTRW
ncbi:uncharacterized protein BXZ73DRAFT_104889 [Epithele typhae]|uniref:uncharacterized protein n=1 Tax=Epithele typhae TaxID=378194 RepID=UPI002008D5C3|nr:uncharacterized protein BXZ73DRAFT_104889 [Epithele typhae]KAH9919782.1 hypothetical protein BXZ73DRAFT_104889 [Epithele typhae]